jgi:hypothetical protein
VTPRRSRARALAGLALAGFGLAGPAAAPAAPPAGRPVLLCFQSAPPVVDVVLELGSRRSTAAEVRGVVRLNATPPETYPVSGAARWRYDGLLDVGVASGRWVNDVELSLFARLLPPDFDSGAGRVVILGPALPPLALAVSFGAIVCPDTLEDPP